MSPRFTALAPPFTTGLSSVVRALDVETQGEVALKRALPGEARSIESLRREAHVLGCVRHPHLVKRVAVGENEGGFYLATEWHTGITLDEWLLSSARGALRIADGAAFRCLFTPILQATSALHAAGFAHGDLTAANVLLVAEPVLLPRSIQLIDLGNAAPLALPYPSPPFDVGSSMLDVRCSNLGSLFSMAPELFDGQAPDVLSDLYALGVMAYFALAGQLPFQGETKPQVIAAHCRHWRTPLEECRPDLPATLIAWIESLMAKRREDRVPSVLAALAELEKLPSPFSIPNS